MDFEAVIGELAATYPDALIVRLPQDVPTEVVCELVPASVDPARGVAIAVIERSAPHFHRNTIESYVVDRGDGVLHLGDDKVDLEPGVSVTIPCNVVHWVEAGTKEIWLTVESVPAWTPEDHILANVGRSRMS